MATVSARRPRSSPARTIALFQPPRDGAPGLLELRTGKADPTGYYLWPIPSDFGTAYRVEKYATQGGEVYDVCLAGELSSCECLGFLRHSHCKHIASLATLAERGQL